MALSFVKQHNNYPSYSAKSLKYKKYRSVFLTYPISLVIQLILHDIFIVWYEGFVLLSQFGK